MPADTEDNSHSPHMAVRNPYTATMPTYKEALLSEASDTSNCLGINTFQVIHLLNKSNNNETNDISSVASDSTEAQTNRTILQSYRMRFQTTIHNTTQESFMEDLARQVNKVLEIININTPGIKLAPWHTNDINDAELISELTDSALDAVRYLYGFKAGISCSGTQNFRICMVFP